jgi:serine/threonine protein kinase
VSFEVRIADGRRFKAHAHLADGDLSVVYAGMELAPEARAVALKVALDAGDNDLIQAELNTLALLRQVESRQEKHLPRALGQFSTADRRLGTVFERLDGLDLTTMRARFESVGQPGVPERHLTWLARRVLSVLGFAHSRGILHGNVDPANIVVRAQDHNVWLVDWCWAVVRPHETGKKLSALNELFGPPEAAARRTPSPASDIYSLGRTMIWAGGGDPVAGTMPASVDPRLLRFFRFMATASQLGRPQDAWALYEQVDRLREEMWGPHQFEELVIPAGGAGT